MTAISSLDEPEQVHRVQCDPSEDDLARSVARAVSDVADVSASDVLGEFSRYADPDALNAVFDAPATDDLDANACYVRLHVEGTEVHVHADGEIVIVS